MVESSILLISKADLQELIEITVISALERYMSAPSIIEDEIFTPKEAAKYLKVSTVTLWKWTKINMLPVNKKGKVVRYRKKDLDNALKNLSKIKSCRNI